MLYSAAMCLQVLCLTRNINILQDWWNVKVDVKRLGPLDMKPNPFKAVRSPLRDLKCLSGTPKYVRIDPAHTYAIDGVGKNFCASAIILLMNLGWFGNGNTDCKFQNAYSRFMAYCNARGKRTSIYEFSYKTFKLPVGSFPVDNLALFGFGQLKIYPGVLQS